MAHLKTGGYCLLAAIVGIALAGCGEGETLVTVTGKVVDGGQPFTIERYEEGGNCLEVEFVPLDQGGNVKPGSPTYARYAGQDGSFLIDGNDGKGIPAGKYRVAVYRRGETENQEGDVWKGKFNRDNSPFTVDITGSQEVVIDIAQSAGSPPPSD